MKIYEVLEYKIYFEVVLEYKIYFEVVLEYKIYFVVKVSHERAAFNYDNNNYANI